MENGGFYFKRKRAVIIIVTLAALAGSLGLLVHVVKEGPGDLKAAEPEMIELSETNEVVQGAEVQTAEADGTGSRVKNGGFYSEDYLRSEVWELKDFSHYVHEKTGGQAYLIVKDISRLDPEELYQDGEKLGYYYSFYVSEEWPDHAENGIWFYVRDDLAEIRCREDDTEEINTLEEWRTSSEYAERMKDISDWNQDKMDLLMASEGEVPDEPWYEAYRSFVMDWTLLEDYCDLSYLEFYFDQYYQFDSYFLCDIDRNKTPELFLYSDTDDMTDMVIIVTYTDQQVVILYEMIEGINLETGEIIMHGHWHGAGGSGEEWQGFRIQGDTFEYSLYLDIYYGYYYEEEREDEYVVYTLEAPEFTRYLDSIEYDKVYAEHVENCIPVDDIVKYNLTDLSGLKDILQ